MKYTAKIELHKTCIKHIIKTSTFAAFQQPYPPP